MVLTEAGKRKKGGRALVHLDTMDDCLAGVALAPGIVLLKEPEGEDTAAMGPAWPPAPNGRQRCVLLFAVLLVMYWALSPAPTVGPTPTTVAEATPPESHTPAAS